MATFSDLFLVIYYQILQVLAMKLYYKVELFVIKMFSQTLVLETNLQNMARWELDWPIR